MNVKVECIVLLDGMEYVCSIVLVHQWQNMRNCRNRDLSYVRISSVCAYNARDVSQRWKDVDTSCADCVDTAGVCVGAEID